VRLLAFAAAAAIVGGCAGNDQPTGRLWFVDGRASALGMRGKIETVGRERVRTPAVALGDLLMGPTPTERTKGLITAIPENTRVRTISVSNGAASVRLRSSVPPNMWRSGVYASAQIVYTMTELENISRVELFVNGKRCCLYDMHHRPISRPLTRRIFEGWQGDPLPPPG
jgi:spore germination protein GerM